MVGKLILLSAFKKNLYRCSDLMNLGPAMTSSLSAGLKVVFGCCVLYEILLIMIVFPSYKSFWISFYKTFIFIMQNSKLNICLRNRMPLVINLYGPVCSIIGEKAYDPLEVR